MAERFKVVLTMQGAIQVLGFTFTAGLAGDVTLMCSPFPVSGACVARNVSDRARYTQQQCADCLAAVFRYNF